MRHFFKRWASNNQLITTSVDSNNSIASAIIHQQVPIIEEEEFDDDEGSLCSILFYVYIYVDICTRGVSVYILTSVVEQK